MSLYLGLFWGVRRTAKSSQLLQYLGPLSDIVIFCPVSGPCLGCSLHRVGAVSIPVPFFTSKKKKLWGRGPSVLPPVLELGAGYPVPRSGVVVYHISL